MTGLTGRQLDGVEADRLRAAGLTVLEYGYPDLLVIEDGRAYGVELKRPGDSWDARAQVPMADAFAKVMHVPYLLARGADDVLSLDLSRVPRDYCSPVVDGRAVAVGNDPWLLASRR